MIETDVDYAVQLLEEAGWKDSDGDGVREKDGLKAAFNLMYFAGFHAAGGSHVGGEPGKGKPGNRRHGGGSQRQRYGGTDVFRPMIVGWGSDSPMTSYMLFHSSNAGKIDFYNPEFFYQRDGGRIP